MMTEEICQNCGKCCFNTEMILSLNDINLILNNSKIYSIDDFVSKNDKGLFQLKNENGECVFFDNSNNECKIYKFRPKGCRFYPLIYDPLDKRCILDKDCPHHSVFMPLKQSNSEICKKLKKYLREDLRII